MLQDTPDTFPDTLHTGLLAGEGLVGDDQGQRAHRHDQAKQACLASQQL